MGPLLLALVAVIVVNALLALYLVGRERRQHREHDRQIATDAAKRSLEEGFKAVRGEQWTQANSPR